MKLPKFVEIIEVGPRDGLQNEAKIIPSDRKVELINLLSKTGIKRIEATSFVSPKHVPQMADASEVYRRIDKQEDVQYMALIPNLRGYELSKQYNVKNIALFVAASETFNQRNVRMSISESMNQLSKVIEEAKENNAFVRFDISTAFCCPFEQTIPLENVLRIVKQLESLEVDEIVICDTIGRANPKQVYEVFSEILDLNTNASITAHFHDTYGMSKANTIAALEAGISAFDTSIGGLGGCPFAPGAIGNDSTEDLVFMLHEMGIETGIDLAKLLQCVELVKGMTEKELTGHINKIQNIVVC